MKTLLLVLVMMINFKAQAQNTYSITSLSSVPAFACISDSYLRIGVNLQSCGFASCVVTTNPADIPNAPPPNPRLERRVYIYCEINNSGNWNQLGLPTYTQVSSTYAYYDVNLQTILPLDTESSVRFRVSLGYACVPGPSEAGGGNGAGNSYNFAGGCGGSSAQTTLIRVLPRTPTYPYITTTPSCSVPLTTGTGSITISNITAYQEGKLYLTNVQIPIMLSNPSPTPACNPTNNANFPLCFFPINPPVIPLLSETLQGQGGVYPATVFNANNASSFTKNDLPPGTYYLSLLNRYGSEPLRCGPINIPIVVGAEAPLLGNYIVPSAPNLPSTGQPSYIVNTPSLNIASIANRSVVVDNSLGGFVSDFKAICCPNMLPSSIANNGIIKIEGKGGKFFSTTVGVNLKIEKSSFANPTSFQPFRNTDNTPIQLGLYLFQPPEYFDQAFFDYYGVNAQDPAYKVWRGEINDLEEGIYKLTVTDACGQTAVNIVPIKKPISVEAVNPSNPVNVVQPRCVGELGSATILLKAEKKAENYVENPLNITWSIYEINEPDELNVYYSVDGGASEYDGDPFFGFAPGSTTIQTYNTTQSPYLELKFLNLPPGQYTVFIDRNQFLWQNILPNNLQCNLAGSLPCDGTFYTFTINAVTPLSIPTTGTNAPLATLITCPTGTIGTVANANSNGIITMTASGTTVGGLYNYQLLKETPSNIYAPVAGQVQTSASANFTGLSAGNYKIITKRNVVGCVDATTSGIIVVSEPPALTTTISTQNISCYGAAGDGTISVTVAGGTPFLAPANTYTVVLNRITNYPTTPYVLLPVSTPANTSIVGNIYTFSNLGDGHYQVEVRDSKPCSLPISSVISVVEPSQLTVTGLTINNIICSTDIATIVPTVAAGTEPYRFFYQVGTATPVEYVATDAFTAGTYTISVKDSRGCVAVFASTVANTVTISSATTPIVAPITLSSFSGGYQISCLNGNNGQITINSVTGGNGIGFTNTYQYKINKTAPTILNGTYQNSIVAGSNVFADLTRGTYDIYVKDSRGCEKVQTFTLTEPNIAIGYNVGLIENVLCANEATGKITITPTGGSGIGYQVAIRKQGLTTALTYVPVTGVTYTFGTLPGTGLRADTYDIYVQDSNGCTSQAQPQTVTSAFPLITANIVQNNISCLGTAPDGALTVTPTAGTAPFTYRWIGSSNTTNTRTGLVAGIYELEIADANGCIEPFRFTITQPALALSATATTDVACYQQANGKIMLTPVGGTPPYQYSKDNGTNWLAGSSTYIFSNLAPQVYNLKVKDSKNCIVALSKTVTERGDTPKIAYLVSTRQNAEDEIVLVNVSVPEPTSTIWEFDANTTVISQANDKAIVRYNAPGSFPVKMIASFTDCVYTSTKNISISPLDTPIPGVTLGTRPIASAVVTPNPSDGNFNLALTLNKRQYVHLILVDAMGNIRYEDKNTTTRFLSVNKNIAVDIPSGVYNLRIITDDDAKDIRITVVK